MTMLTLVIIAFIVFGIGLAALIIRSTARIDATIQKYIDEASADRRAMQDSMDAFRAEMQRLAAPQSGLKGMQQDTQSLPGRCC